MNAVTVEHRDGGAGATHACTITDGPVKRILVVFDSTNAAHTTAATKLLVDAAVLADPDLTGPLIDVTDDGVAPNTIVVLTETRIEGTADQEAHRLPSGLLDTLTTAEPLAEGDAVGIWYPYVIEPGPTAPAFGGRQESNPDRGTSTIPIASLFVTSNDPEKIPGAVPLCKVLNNELVWFDGSRYVEGASGPIGTVSSLYIDDANFAGAKTNSSNGGIDNPLSPASAQEAFDNVDDRLGQLRAFSYVCTDGTASTGGDFNGSTALELAITQLAGLGGTVYLRRGTYNVPSLYTYGANVRIVGEHETLVTIQPTVSSNQFLATGMRFEHVTLGTNFLDLRIISPEDDVQFKNCIFTGTVSSEVTISADAVKFENVVWTTDSTAPNTTIFNVFGDDGTFKNCSFPGGVSLSGDRNRLDNCEIRHIADSIALSVIGVGNTLRDIRVNKTAGTTGVIGTLLLLGGTDTLVDGLTAITTASAIPTTDSVMQMGASGGNQHFKRLHITAGDHMALEYVAGATGSATYTDSVFTNLSTTTDTFAATAIIADYAFARFDNCIFDDNSQLGNSVANLAFANDENAHRWQFYNCQFKAATFSTTPCGQFRHADFYGCSFLFQHTNIPGVDQGILDGLWRFDGVASTVIGADNGRCTVQDCTFDMADAEIIDDSSGPPGDPFFDGAYVEITHGDLINPQFINLSRYGNRRAGTPGGSVLRLNEAGRVNKASFTWTSTAFVQTGSGPADQGWIRVAGDYVTVENVKLVGTLPAAFTHIPYMVGVDNVACKHFTMHNCTFADLNGAASSYFRMTTPTGTGHTDWSWHNVQLGVAGLGDILIALPLLIGAGCQINGCRFVFSFGTTAADIIFGAAAAGGNGPLFTNNSIISRINTPVSKSPFDSTGSDLDHLVFCNNVVLYQEASPSTDRFLFSGIPASATDCVAAGNIFRNTGGTGVTQDGAVTLTAPNVGLP